MKLEFINSGSKSENLKKIFKGQCYSKYIKPVNMIYKSLS